MNKILAEILRAIREKKRPPMPKTWWPKSDFWNTAGTIVLAGLTGGLFWVGLQQANILDRTDKTQRVIQRAFIIPKPIEIVGLPKRDPKDVMQWQINVKWENTGNTAPQKLSIFTFWHLQNGTDKNPVVAMPPPPTPEEDAKGNFTFSKWHFASFTPKGQNWPTSPHLTTLGPHQIRVGDHGIVTAGSMRRLQTGAALVAIVGLASYVDAFGKKRITMFCQHLVVPNIDYENGEPEKPREVWGPDCQDYNCTDDECQKYKGADWLPPDVIPEPELKAP